MRCACLPSVAACTTCSHAARPSAIREHDDERREDQADTAVGALVGRHFCARLTYTYSDGSWYTSPSCFVAAAVMRGDEIEARVLRLERGVLREQLRPLGVRRVEAQVELEDGHVHEYDACEENPADRRSTGSRRGRARAFRVRASRGRATGCGDAAWRASLAITTFVPTRRRADCARGLRAISAARRADRAARRRAHRRLRPADADREVGRARAALLLAAQELLDEPVLERVERDHAEPPAGAQHLERRRQRALDGAELVVHLDAERLEDALRRMALAEARRRRNRGLDHLDEVAGALERLLAAPLRDRARDRARVPLLAVPLEDVGELALAQPR